MSYGTACLLRVHHAGLALPLLPTNHHVDFTVEKTPCYEAPLQSTFHFCDHNVQSTHSLSSCAPNFDLFVHRAQWCVHSHHTLICLPMAPFISFSGHCACQSNSVGGPTVSHWLTEINQESMFCFPKSFLSYSTKRNQHILNGLGQVLLKQ